MSAFSDMIIFDFSRLRGINLGYAEITPNNLRTVSPSGQMIQGILNNFRFFYEASEGFGFHICLSCLPYLLSV